MKDKFIVIKLANFLNKCGVVINALYLETEGILNHIL